MPSTSSRQASEAGTVGAVEGFVPRHHPWLSDHRAAAEEPSSSSARFHQAPSSAAGKQLNKVAEASAQQQKRVSLAPTAAPRKAQIKGAGAKRPMSRGASESIVKEAVRERGFPADGMQTRNPKPYQPPLPLAPQDGCSVTDAAPHTEQQLENGAGRQQTLVLGFGDSGGTTPGCQTHSPAAEQPSAVLVFEVEDPNSVLDGAQVKP